MIGKEFPVVMVNWHEATEFCKWLSNKLNTAFRLPTEAEWGENLTTDQANYNGDYPYKYYPNETPSADSSSLIAFIKASICESLRLIRS